MSKFLDSDGLTSVLTKIKSYINTKISTLSNTFTDKLGGFTLEKNESNNTVTPSTDYILISGKNPTLQIGNFDYRAFIDPQTIMINNVNTQYIYAEGITASSYITAPNLFTQLEYTISTGQPTIVATIGGVQQSTQLQIHKLGDTINVGSKTRPIYLSGGTPNQCNTPFTDLSVSGTTLSATIFGDTKSVSLPSSGGSSSISEDDINSYINKYLTEYDTITSLQIGNTGHKGVTFTVPISTDGEDYKGANWYIDTSGESAFSSIYTDSIKIDTSYITTTQAYFSTPVTASSFNGTATNAKYAQYASNIKWHTCNYGPSNWGSASFIDVEIGKNWLGLDNDVTNDYHLFICTITDDDNSIGVHCIFNKYTNYSWRLINYSPLLDYDYNTITTSISEAGEYGYTIDGYDGECNITIKGYFI